MFLSKALVRLLKRVVVWIQYSWLGDKEELEGVDFVLLGESDVAGRDVKTDVESNRVDPRVGYFFVILSGIC